MKTLLFFLIMFSVTAVAPAQDSEDHMKGTEQPVFRQKTTDRNVCRVFSKYLIRTTDYTPDVGQMIGVYNRDAGTPSQLCKVRGKRLLVVNEDKDADYFNGLSGKYMFVDSGTSAGNRGMDIYDLTTGKSIFSTDYYDSNAPKLVGGRYFEFEYPTDKKGDIRTCKEAAEWKKQGGGIQWVITKRFDLQTRTTATIGGLKCAYME